MLVVCGEALMDVFTAGDASTSVALRAHAGGSPFNVAVGLARLGAEVGFLGAISRDLLGTRLVRALEQEGVSTLPVVRTDAPTTLSLVALDEQGVPAYTFYGTDGADRQLHANALPAAARGARALHVGSYSTVVEPTASALRALVEDEHRRSVISYDPNVRLNVEPALARWTEAMAWMTARADIVKVSEEDLGLLCPGRDTDALATAWLEQGVHLLVVTRGARGAIAWTHGMRVEAGAVPTRVVDTVGAGDSFQAAMLAWLDRQGLLTKAAVAALERAQVAEMLAYAMAAAAITCSRAGADLPRRAELPH
jgi:fructokinase